MPATTLPAGTEWGVGRKTHRISLPIGDLSTASIGDSILAFFDFLNEATIDEFGELLLNPRRGLIEIKRDNRRALDLQDLRFAEADEDAVLGFSHPLGSVPDGHNRLPIHKLTQSSLGIVAYTGNSLNRTGNTIKGLASSHDCTDRPGAFGEGLRAGACDPRPGGRTDTTMYENTQPAGKDTGSASMATIVRADRAYHDVAQLHLHEFGGGA